MKHLFSNTQPQSLFLEVFKALANGKQAVVDWYLATIYSDIISKHSIFKELKNLNKKEDTVLFFQWTMNNALLVPLLHQWGFQNIVCRMHGFDLYEFRHNHYLPYKSKLLKHAKICTFISAHGRDYASSLYPFIKAKSQLHYLGAEAMPKNNLVTGEKFHLISISRVVPLKRLELIVEAIKSVNMAIKWTHIGDGYALDDIMQRVKAIEDYNPHCEVEFLGWLSPKAIRSYFKDHGINALILVSETEGLPVVIMEAFSASIPVIATGVGGVSELVNNSNGILLSANPEVYEIVDAIKHLDNESQETQDFRRQKARQAYSNSFELDKNSKAFINFLLQQCS